MWFAIKLPTESQDKDHLYKGGDPFPREGKEVSEDRIKESASSNNVQGQPLIAEKKPKKRGRKKKE